MRALQLVIAIAFLSSPRAAEAAPKQKAVMLEFQGWNAPKARKVAVKAVSKVVHLIPKKQVKMASKLIDAPANNPAGVTKLLVALEAPMAIEGTISGDGILATTTIQIFARDGRRLAKWTGSGPSSQAGEEDIAIGAREAVREAVKKLQAAPIDNDRVIAALAAPRNNGKVTRYRRADQIDEEPSEDFALEVEPSKPIASDKPSLVTAWSADSQSPLAIAMAPSMGVPLVKSQPAARAQLASAAQPASAAPSSAPAAPQPASPLPAQPMSQPIGSSRSAQPAVSASALAQLSSTNSTNSTNGMNSTNGEVSQQKQPFAAPEAPALATSTQIKAYDADDAPSLAMQRAPSGRTAFARPIIVPKDEIVAAPTNARTLSALAGVTFRRRLAELSLDDDSTARHDTGTFPELTLFARTRPFARSGDALSGVFADLEGAYAIGLSSRSLDEDTTVGTQALRLRFAGGWVYEAGAFSAGASLGFGMESFTLEENPVIGSSSYTFVRPGLLARAELAGESFAVELDAGYRAVLSTGDIGEPYQQAAKAMGFDASARLCGAIDLGFSLSYAVQVGYQRHLLSFGEPKEDPGSRALAMNGIDSSLLATAALGIALR